MKTTVQTLLHGLGSHRRIVVLVALAASVACGIAWFSVWQLRADAISDSRLEINQLGRVLATQTERAFADLDARISDVQQEIVRADPLTLDHLVTRLHGSTHFLPGIGLRVREERLSLALSDPESVVNGNDLNGDAITRIPPAECARFLTDPPASGLLVRSGATLGGLAISLTRRLNRPDDTALGCLTASMLVSEFESLFSRSGLHDGFGAALLSVDGFLIARYPEQLIDAGGKLPIVSKWYDRVEHGGDYHSPGYLGLQGSRWVSVHKLTRYPLVLNAYRLDSATLARWHRQTIQILVALLAGMLSSALLGRQLWRQFHALEASKAEITEIAAALAESQRNLRLESHQSRITLEHMNQGIMMVDPTGMVAVCNQKVCELLNLPSEWMATHPAFRDVVVYQQKAGEFQGRADHLPYLAGSGILATKEHRYERQRPNGTVIEIHSIPLDDGGRVRTYTDITARRQAEQTLLQTERLRAIGQLSGGVAHDFNNMLMVISMNLEMISDYVASSDEALGLLAQVQIAVRSGTELSRRLLSFARQQPLAPQVVDIAALLPPWQDLVSRGLGRGSSLSLKMGPDLLPILIDRGQLESALLNLVLNACDAQPNGGEITIRAEQVRISDDAIAGLVGDTRPMAGQYVRLEVADHGEGIAPEMVHRVFEPFVTTKPIGHGTGLGLSMVSGFIWQSGGAVALESVVGEGTRLSLYLPCATNADTADTLTSATKRPEFDALRIMIVEERADVRFAAENLCRGIGLLPIFAADAHAALLLLAGHDPVDLLLADMNLQGPISAFELTERAKLKRAGLHVILTSNALPEVSIMDRGFCILRKPYSIHDLRTVLKDRFHLRV
jgi:signal transduction histidine kinase